MKRIYIIIILVTSMFSQNQLALSGGINFGTIKYNNKTLQNLIDLDYQPGFSIAIETNRKRSNNSLATIIGITYIQRGVKVGTNIGEISMSGYDVYNYLSVYGLLPIINLENFIASAGFQVGKMIGGKTDWSMADGVDIISTSEDLEGGDFNIDYGVIAAIDLKIAPQIGFRGSYYLGLTNIYTMLNNEWTDDLNAKNRGVEIKLLYTLK